MLSLVYSPVPCMRHPGIQCCRWYTHLSCVCDIQIDVDSEYARRCTGKQLKEALANYEARLLSGDKNADLKMKLEYYVLLPDPMTHENHVLQEVIEFERVSIE
jgi:hypothetical protein